MEAQLFANLTGALDNREVASRLETQLRDQDQQVMSLLLQAVNLPGVVERLPWQAQYRVAISWLLSQDPRISAVAWDSRVNTALAVAQAPNRMAARRALDQLFDMVAAKAYLTTEPLDFTPLVPPCGNEQVQCTHCEGRPWPKESGVAYCPTLRSSCGLDQRGAPPSIFVQSGPAWIKPNLTLPPSQWSVLELLQHAGLKPRDLYPDLPRDEDLVSRLGGWLNRLNKIRARIHCRTCNSIMQPRKDYAKFLAKFPVTVFMCKEHPTPVKLTDCWLCESLVDSRDSPISDGHSTYNVCRRCGAGEQRKATIGRHCPKCGQGPMQFTAQKNRQGRHEVLQCAQSGCGHKIAVLPKQIPYLASEIAEQ